jgi:hypothetical protein
MIKIAVPKVINHFAIFCFFVQISTRPAKVRTIAKLDLAQEMLKIIHIKFSAEIFVIIFGH